MHRGKKLILTAHCILNQNSVIRHWERAVGAYTEVVRILLDHNIGIIQLPCPEFTYQGESRPPKTKEEYNTSGYRAHCNKLAGAIVDQLKEYIENGYYIIGLLGIEESPTCDTKTDPGIFMEELFSLLANENIILNTIDIPASYVEGTGEDFLHELNNFISLS